MIFLLNRERVLVEVVELARLKIAAILKVAPTAVTARIELKAGKVSPVFELESDAPKGVSEADVREVIASVYAGTMSEYAARAEGLQMTRRQIGVAA